jgi:hypothetical protein
VHYPTNWIFALDERATHMSLISTADDASPTFATPKTVDQVVASFLCTRATPPDVVALLDLAHKLLRTSVVHYEFAALAAEKSLQALERALRLRLDASGRVRFKKLIDRAAKEGLVSGEDLDLMDTGRELRNFLAHPATSAAIPLILVTGMVKNSHRLIAVLFPDDETAASEAT